MNSESIQPTKATLEADLEHLTHSAYLFGLEDVDSPILSLDSASRSAFFLHHLPGYKIEDAALLVELSEKTFEHSCVALISNWSHVNSPPTSI